MRGRPPVALHGHRTTAGGLTPYVVTRLLALYAAAGDLRTSLRLFSLLPSPSLYAYTPLLSLLSRSNLPLRALSLYSLLRRSGLSPDPVVFPHVLTSCRASTAALPAVHSDAVKFGALANAAVSNALVAAYVKPGDMSSARAVFDETSERDVYSYNALMAGYAAIGDAAIVIELLESMYADKCFPDLVTWNTVMDAYCRVGRCEDALKVLHGLDARNVVSWTTIVVGYARVGDHAKSVSLFREMVFEGRVKPDVDILSCVLSMCRHIAAFQAGRSVHAYGLKGTESRLFYQSAGVALVTLYAACKKVSAAEAVFQCLNLEDVVTWNAMIAGLAQAGMGDLLLEYFREMNLNGLLRNATTYATVLSACDLTSGKQIHCYIMRNCCDFSTVTSNALIAMYAQSGKIEAARKVFFMMQDKDVVSWNSIIGAYASNGLGNQALDMLHLMENSGLKPDAITVSNILTACCHCGIVGEGINLFERMVQRAGVTPTMVQCSCIVDMLCRAGRLDKAVEFIAEMPMKPNARIWGALLSASLVHQNVEFGRLAFDNLVQIEPENPGSLVTMSTIYMQAGRSEDANRMRKMIDTKVLAKPSGNSWMESVQR